MTCTAHRTGRTGNTQHDTPEHTQQTRSGKKQTTGKKKRGWGKKKGGGATRRQGPGHPRPEKTQSRRQRGAKRGGKKKKKGGGDKTSRPKSPGAGKHAKQNTTGAQQGGEGEKGTKKKTNHNHKGGNPSPEGAEQAKSEPRTAKGKVRGTKTRPGGRPARPGQAGHAHAHTRGTRAWRPPTRKGRCLRPQQKAPVHRPSPPSQDGRYGKLDASVTGSTHAKPTQRTQPKTEAGGTRQGQPHRGAPNGSTRSAPSAPASAGASGRHNKTGSRAASTCPAQPPSKAGGDSPRGGGRHHGDGKADRSTESDRTGRGAAHQRGATRQATEARRRPQPRHQDRCQATTATGCRKPGKRAQHTTNRGTG